MRKYLSQLLEDIEAVILERWKESPPHYYQMGLLAEKWLTPPKGWDGPPPGYALEEDEHEESLEEFFAGLKEQDVLANPMPVEERIAVEFKDQDPDFPYDEDEIEGMFEEVEEFVSGTPKKNMYYHFGLNPEQFPTVDSLTEEEAKALTVIISRLWATFNITPVYPDDAPGKIVYPILIERMKEVTFVFSQGNLGVEFCDYNPANCPFGEWCNCKNF